MFFGEKVRAWLRRNRDLGTTPASDKDLADTINRNQPIVSRTLNWPYRSTKSRAPIAPGLDIALDISRVMGVSLHYLADPDLSWPIDDLDDAWTAQAAVLTPSERAALLDAISRPDVKRLLLAAHRERAGRGGPSATPK